MMKNIKKFFALLLLALCCAPSWGQSVRRTANGWQAENGKLCVELEVFSPSIVRVKKYPAGQQPEKQSYSVVMQPSEVQTEFSERDGQVQLSTSALQVAYDVAADRFVFSDAKGRVLLQEKAGSAAFQPFDNAGSPSYRVSQTFQLEEGESVFGLGQHQQGHWSQRGQQVRLQQVNMEIAIPLVHSIKGYAVFWDNYSTTTFTDNEQGMTFDSEAGNLGDYYFVYGGNADGVVAGLRQLTGQAPMYPLWTFGFWQSRERYTGQDELVGAVAKYREIGVPLDGIIQDWRYWGEDNHKWSAIEFLNPNFPDPAKMLRQVHDMNAHAMISIWPSVGPDTKLFKALGKRGKLMWHETFPQDNGVRVYNAYDPEAQDIYWSFIKRNMFDIGMDAWWLDATEPEHSPISPEDYDYQTGVGTFREVRNAFPLVSVGGVYERQREASDAKRVFILTRSAFLGQQRYAAQVWSGDVNSNWQVLRNQIPAALNFSLSGMPYWNSDIGGFFAGSYEGGYKNPKFQELYVRWMQFATFTSIMRSHGTNTWREIYLFGDRGYWAFDAQEKFINLRYRLIPYLYSTAWQVSTQGISLMRPLFADFVQDKKVAAIDDEFLFGRSFLVAPVVEEGAKNREVYLPKGTKWVDFWTGKSQRGGRTVTRETPIDLIPLYVKAGTILPVGPTVQYAEEKPWDDLQIRVYPGADGEFVLYEDEGDNYNYEKGRYSTIRMTWDNSARRLTIHPREGSFDGMLQKRNFRIVLVDGKQGLGLDNESCTVSVGYDGGETTVKL